MAVMRSRRPTSTQQTPHSGLQAAVQRHLSTEWAQPLRAHTQQAFDQLAQRIGQHPHRPVIVDSRCRAGQSTRQLAHAHPNHWVVGVDRSSHRLSKAPQLPDNAVCVRAELADFWRLVVAARWQVDGHYVLYPNPYPKASQLKRRWHGHPVWPSLLAVGERLVLRTNSSLYAQEWRLALQWSNQASIQARPLATEQINALPLSPFEKKYAASGHALDEVTSQRRPALFCPHPHGGG